jgi:hypothetical protein
MGSRQSHRAGKKKKFPALYFFLIFNNIRMIGKAVSPIVNFPWMGLYVE